MPVLCAHCRSANVEPRGQLWHCNDCGKDIDLAGGNIDEFLPDPPAKKPRKKGG
jgi:ribosomal protein L37AE/L43A